MSSTNTSNIIPKPCNYNCGTRIYWNTSENAYFEVFSKKRHSCSNRSNIKKSVSRSNYSHINNTNRQQSFYYTI